MTRCGQDSKPTSPRQQVKTIQFKLMQRVAGKKNHHNSNGYSVIVLIYDHCTLTIVSIVLCTVIKEILFILDLEKSFKIVFTGEDFL